MRQLKQPLRKSYENFFFAATLWRVCFFNVCFAADLFGFAECRSAACKGIDKGRGYVFFARSTRKR